MPNENVPSVESKVLVLCISIYYIVYTKGTRANNNNNYITWIGCLTIIQSTNVDRAIDLYESNKKNRSHKQCFFFIRSGARLYKTKQCQCYIETVHIYSYTICNIVNLTARFYLRDAIMCNGQIEIFKSRKFYLLHFLRNGCTKYMYTLYTYDMGIQSTMNRHKCVSCICVHFFQSHIKIDVCVLFWLMRWWWWWWRLPHYYRAHKRTLEIVNYNV